MTRSLLLEEIARGLLEDEWTRLGWHDPRETQPAGSEPNTGRLTAEACPALWILPDLLSVIGESPGHAAAESAPAIRGMITDLYFVDECGDTILGRTDRDEIEAQVSAVIRVLEQVRKIALAQGHWSNQLVGPEMFG